MAVGAQTGELTDEAKFKLAVMQVIDRELRDRYDTMIAAAEAANVSWARLSRLRRGRHDQFSIAWLFRLARDTGVRIRISID